VAEAFSSGPAKHGGFSIDVRRVLVGLANKVANDRLAGRDNGLTDPSPNWLLLFVHAIHG
jgi:hypothetical protein